MDMTYVFKQLKPLCELKESPDILDKLQNIFNTMTSDSPLLY